MTVGILLEGNSLTSTKASTEKESIVLYNIYSIFYTIIINLCMSLYPQVLLNIDPTLSKNQAASLQAIKSAVKQADRK